MKLKNIIKLKNIFIILFFIILIYFIFNLFYSNNNNTNKIIKCNQKFALCPQAKCLPSPTNKNNGLCECFVKTGINYSVGGNSCNNLTHYKDGLNEYIYSTFSPIIKKMGYNRITCPSNGVMLNCMNKICSVDPNNPDRAICECSKVNTNNKQWSTFNKNNTNSSCNYLSGAFLDDSTNMDLFIKNNIS